MRAGVLPTGRADLTLALLQIAEPGEATAPHQHRRAVGSALGTTNSLVAAVRSGTAQVLLDAAGEPLLPSVVRYFADGRIVVGREAKASQAEDPENTIVSVKRFMGRGIADVAKYGALPYHFEDLPGMVRLRTVAGIKSPTEEDGRHSGLIQTATATRCLTPHTPARRRNGRLSPP